jgi:DNA-binding NtrC family response regulator
MPRILLVDDEENILHALQRLFKSDGYEVETYTNATEALKRARAAEFDLVMSDYRMPGMDGVFFLTALKQIQPDAMRLLASGYTDLDALLGAINEAQIFRFIAKPWCDYDLRATVAHALVHRAMLEENRRLADQVRAQEDKIQRQSRLIQEFEVQHPDIARVRRSADGAILLEEDED